MSHWRDGSFERWVFEDMARKMRYEIIFREMILLDESLERWVFRGMSFPRDVSVERWVF